MRPTSRLSRLLPKATPAGSQLVLLTATGCRMILSLVLAVLLGRYLAAAEFGYFVLVGTVFELGRELSDLGNGNLALRQTAQAPERERRTLENLLGLRLALSAVAAGACIVLALEQDTLWHEALLLATATVLVVCCLSAFNIVFQRRQTLLAPALLSVLVQFGTVIAGIILLGLQTAGALFASLVLMRELVIAIGTRQLAVRLLGYAPWPRLGRGAMHDFVGNAAMVAFATLLYRLQVLGGIFFVEFLRPQPELGAFAAAFRPLVPLLFIPWILVLPLMPLLSWVAATQRDAFRRQAQIAMNLCIGIGAVMAVATAETAPAILQFFYGTKFGSGPLSAIAALRWFSLPLGYSFTTAAFAIILLADKRERQLLQLSLVGFACYVCANLLLLPRYQFTGGAIATALAMTLTNIGGLMLLRRGSEGFVLGRQTLLFLLPATVLFAALHFVTAPALVELSIAGVLSGAALFALWHFPGVAEYRAEQATLTRLALDDGAAAAGALEVNG
jgi:O-antigen/teichoic acid export membrane protein